MGDFLITSMDASAIANAIQRLIEDAELRAALGANAREIRNADDFGYSDLLERLIGGSVS